MGTLKLGNKTLATQTGTDNPVLTSNVSYSGAITSSATFPAGHVLQVVQATDITWDGQSLSGSTTLDWVSQSITRIQNNSKILVTFSGHYAKSANVDNGVRLQRGHNSTNTLLGNGSGSAAGTGRAFAQIWTSGTDTGYMQAPNANYAMTPVSFQFLDTLSINDLNAITYTVKIWVEGSVTIYRNGDGWRGSDTQSHSTMAKLLLQEIAV